MELPPERDQLIVFAREIGELYQLDAPATRSSTTVSKN
jgi:hypothetical protein